MRHLHLWKPGNHSTFDNLSPEAEEQIIAEALKQGGWEVLEQIADHTECQYTTRLPGVYDSTVTA